MFVLGVSNMEGPRHSGAITRVKWGQEVNADDFEEVSLVNPQQHPMGGGSHQQSYYAQESLLSRRAKSGGGRFAGLQYSQYYYYPDLYVFTVYDIVLLPNIFQS